MEKKKLILLLLSCAVITEAHAAYQGHVYVDSNRNGIYDKGEKVLNCLLYTSDAADEL